MYEYRAIVRNVHDGDTVTLAVDQGFNDWKDPMHIRLFGINAPELKTPEGIISRDFLASRIPVGDKILLRSHKDRADKYGGRWDGTLLQVTWLPDGHYEGEININQWMVDNGYAVAL